MTIEEVQAALGALADGIGRRFGQAATALASAHRIVERLVASLEGAAAGLDREAADAAVETMRATADSLARLPHLQRDRQAQLGAIREASKDLRDHIAQIHRTLSFLRICGLNIKVASAGAEEFAGFADNISARLDLGEGQLASFRREARQLADKVSDMVAAEAMLASECARVIPQAPGKLAEDALALQQHQADTAALARRTGDAARAIRDRLATALAAIRIGDITRERLGHVRAGILSLAAFLRDQPGMAASAAAAIEGHVLALLAAQASDTVDDFRREARLLAQGLRDIAADANRLPVLLGDGEASGGGDVGGALRLLEQGVAEVESLTVRLRAADEQADRLGHVTSGIAESLAERLKAVRKVQSDVEQMAWNTGLRCRRMGENGLALAAIATEIRRFSNNLDVVSGRISQTSEQFAGAAGSIRERRRHGDRVDAGETLAESLASIRAGGERMQQGLAGLDDDAAVVVAMLRDSVDRVDCEAEIGRAFDRVATALAPFVPAGDLMTEEAAGLLAEILGVIAGGYTMAREREVHRRFALVVDARDEDLLEGALGGALSRC